MLRFWEIGLSRPKPSGRNMSIAHAQTQRFRRFLRVASLFCFCVLPLLSGAADRGFGVVAAPDGNTPVGEQHLFVIGIDRYEHWTPLNGAVTEVKRLREVLLRRYLFSEEHTVPLLNDAATKGNIVKQFRDYKASLSPHDSLLVVYCGHGYLDQDSKVGYWVPVDGGRDRDTKDRWLPNAVLRGFLSRMRSRHVLVVADSCFSGDLLDTNRSAPDEITVEYYRKAYQRISRQVMTSGASEAVRDASAFGDALFRELDGNVEPWIDPHRLFGRVRLAVSGQTPLLGALNTSGHQAGAAFLFFLRPEAAHIPSPTFGEVTPIVTTGQLLLSCRVSGTLLIDGKKLGRVESGKRYQLKDVTSGQRQVRVACADGVEWNALVNVPVDGTVEAEAAVPRKDPAPKSRPPSRPPSGPAGPQLAQDWTVPDLGMAFVWIAQLKMWVGKYEVTNGEYRVFKPGHDSKDYKEHSLNGERQPVVYVNFDDACDYAKWLTDRERAAGRLPDELRFRLPTKDEWLAFAQCGDGREYPWGGEYPPRSGQAGNYSGQESAYKGKIDGYTDGHAVACDVSESWKNPWGLYGVGGNVWECCAKQADIKQPFGAWRGASWYCDFGVSLRCSYRFLGIGGSCRDVNYGFRLVLSR